MTYISNIFSLLLDVLYVSVGKQRFQVTEVSVGLDRMDGFKSAHHGSTAGDKSTAQQQAPRESIEDFLSSCGDSYFERKSNSQSGKKRVRVLYFLFLF